MRFYLKNNQSRVGRMAQVVEFLPGKQEAESSNSRTTNDSYSDDDYDKITTAKWAGGVAQAVELPPT
jgi:hypothetical protein